MPMKKLSVSLCDDEPADASYLALLLRGWAEQRGQPLEIACYPNAESFLFAEGHAYDILLLDIQMNGMDGLSLARRVREKNGTVPIVFITGFPDFMAEGYDVSALHYLMKPVKEEKLWEVLDRAVISLNKAPRSIVFPIAGGDCKLLEDNILYAEVLSHTVTIHLKAGGEEEVRLRMSDLEELLGCGEREAFFRCHRSYIVSMRYVRRVCKAEVILEDGTRLPLSRGLYDAANQAFIQFN